MAQFKVKMPPKKGDPKLVAEDFFRAGLHASMVASIFVWRLELREKFFTQEIQDPCPICYGRQEIEDLVYGHIRCICMLRSPDLLEEQRERIKFSSRMTKKDLNLEVWGSEEQKNEIIKLLDAVQHFEQYGDSWLTIIGRPGVGKTHAAQWIAQRLDPWALYISSTEFESGMFDTLSDGDLGNFKEAMKTTPVLIFDDLGAAYGSKFGVAGITEIIDFRWNEAKQFPTIVTTNLSRTSVMQISPRIADRIFDVHTSKIIEMNNCLSWRTAHV